MELKLRLQKRLLDLPINARARRELYSLADDLDVEYKEIEPLLEELCNNKILIKKTEYICNTCKNTIILTDSMLKELMKDADYLECEECSCSINQKLNKSGFIYYDIVDMESLISW